MQSVYVKPKEGGRVRQPERASRVMPAEGALVPRNGYYTRLILAGDVVITDVPKAAPAPAAESQPGAAPAPAPQPSPPSPSPAPAARG